MMHNAQFRLSLWDIHPPIIWIWRSHGVGQAFLEWLSDKTWVVVALLHGLGSGFVHYATMLHIGTFVPSHRLAAVHWCAVSRSYLEEGFGGWLVE
jgi:hypothetical protein